MDQRHHRVIFLAALVFLTAGTSLAQDITTDFDILLVPTKKDPRQGEEFGVDASIAVRKTGAQGWSYGVAHDTQVLEALEVTTTGSDVPSIYNQGFEQTTLVENGWIQAIVLSLKNPVELPITPVGDPFVMAKSRYKVRSGICNSQTKVDTSISFSKSLFVPGSPPVDISISIDGKSYEPSIQQPAELTIQCPTPGSLDLKLLAQVTEGEKLVADKVDTLDIRLSVENRSQDAAAVQAWSYGLSLDPAVLTAVDLTSSAVVSALNGGTGPDFRAYAFDPLATSADGTVKGITSGVVISLEPPADDTLPLPAGGVKVLEILKVKSAIQLNIGDPDRTTQLKFVNEVLLTGDLPLENLVVVDAIGISPKVDTPALVLTLTAPTLEKRFIRGFANPDNRYDIADGIWTIQVIFFQQGRFSCQKAADVNDDGKIDLSDAVYTFNYLLQPGKHSGDALYPRPLMPYPACGTDPTPDSLTCEEASGPCK